MTLCPCTVNSAPHLCRFVRVRDAAALIGRPLHTVDSWRKRGQVPSRTGDAGKFQVCVCCAAATSSAAANRWEPRARRAVLPQP